MLLEDKWSEIAIQLFELSALVHFAHHLPKYWKQMHSTIFYAHGTSFEGLMKKQLSGEIEKLCG